jgi:hypothetical protein
MTPILMIPHDLGIVDDILEVAGTILECLQEAHASGIGDGTSRLVLWPSHFFFSSVCFLFSVM